MVEIDKDLTTHDSRDQGITTTKGVYTVALSTAGATGRIEMEIADRYEMDTTRVGAFSYLSTDDEATGLGTTQWHYTSVEEAVSSGVFSAEIETPFEFQDGFEQDDLDYPLSGTMTITLADATVVRVEVLADAHVRVSYDQGGDGATEAEQTLSWNDFSQAFLTASFAFL